MSLRELFAASIKDAPHGIHWWGTVGRLHESHCIHPHYHPPPPHPYSHTTHTPVAHRPEHEHAKRRLEDPLPEGEPGVQQALQQQQQQRGGGGGGGAGPPGGGRLEDPEGPRSVIVTPPATKPPKARGNGAPPEGADSSLWAVLRCAAIHSAAADDSTHTPLPAYHTRRPPPFPPSPTPRTVDCRAERSARPTPSQPRENRMKKKSAMSNCGSGRVNG